MISFKRIDMIAWALILAVVLLLTFYMRSFHEVDSISQTKSVAYTDDIFVVYTMEDYNTAYQDDAYSKIILSENSASTDSANVLIDGETITILGGGVYELSGTLQDGSIIVHTNDTIPVQLVLNNASINSNNFSAIYVEHAASVILTLSPGTQNILSDGNSYDCTRQENDKPDAALYCRANLTINGTGTLSVCGNYQDGIKCNDILKVMSGTISINAKDDGVRANDCMVLLGADLNIIAENDAVYSEGDLVLHETNCTISCADDVIHAEQTVVLEPETLSILQCLEGVEGKYIIINDGSIEIQARDDGINAVGNNSAADMMRSNRTKEITEENSYLRIYGGTIRVTSSGDGLDSNGAAILSGGNVMVYGPENNGNASLDIVYGMRINGGSLLAAGSSGMAELPRTDSVQNVLAFYLPEMYSAESSIALLDAMGNTIVEAVSQKRFNWVCISTAEITTGDTYTLYVNGNNTASLICTDSVSSSGSSNRFGNIGNTVQPGGKGGMRNNAHKTIYENT